MKRILLIGAGRSAKALVNYIQSHAKTLHWHLTVADFREEAAAEILEGFPEATPLALDVKDSEHMETLVGQADLVISMLPAHMHLPVAKTCLQAQKHLLTASYVSPEMKALDRQAKAQGTLILMEMGLDPGIDHMSAKKEIDTILEMGGEIEAFKSFTGGLVAPESDNNPWNYKFTWNPRNVVLAGQGVVQFVRNRRYKYIPYSSLFKRTEVVEVEGYGAFEGYANRDSLKYRELYDLGDVPTLFRGTLRRPGFCRAWAALVQLGLTDDSYKMEQVDSLTWREYLNTFLVYSKEDKVEAKLASFLEVKVDDPVIQKIKWLGLFDDRPVGLTEGSPAQLLQHLLEQRWKLEDEDQDMIVMQHQFEYRIEEKVHRTVSSLVVKGDDAANTSMAKTVGLPLGIAARLLLEGQLKLTGVQIPVVPEIYEPVLLELEDFGIKFVTSEH